MFVCIIISTDVFAGLVHQLTRMTEEHRDVERQSEKDRNSFEHQMRDSEMTIEELHIKMERVLEEKKNETDDLHRQIEATNKQLAANRKFLEVSAAIYDSWSVFFCWSNRIPTMCSTLSILSLFAVDRHDCLSPGFFIRLEL